MSTKIYINEDNFKLYLDDSFSRLKKIKSGTVNMIFSDPPYFLSGEGITCKSGKMESVKKADWDEKISLKEKLKFNRSWIKQCHRILDNNGSLWISGTMHNIYTIGYALELENFKIINNITWRKLNPPPNISCRAFTHSTETVIWAKKNLPKSKHLFNYDLVKEINGGKQMKDVWTGSLTKPSEKKEGKHPTQKPEYLLEQIRSELPKKPLKNGSQMRITTLINICDLLEKNFKKLDNMLKEENEALRLESVRLRAEGELKSQEISKLIEQNALKDSEIESIVDKLESIMA